VQVKRAARPSLGDHKTFCPQILPAMLHLVAQVNESRTRGGGSALIVKERNLVRLVNNVAYFSRGRGGESVVQVRRIGGKGGGREKRRQGAAQHASESRGMSGPNAPFESEFR